MRRAGLVAALAALALGCGGGAGGKDGDADRASSGSAGKGPVAGVGGGAGMPGGAGATGSGGAPAPDAGDAPVATLDAGDAPVAAPDAPAAEVAGDAPADRAPDAPASEGGGAGISGGVDAAAPEGPPLRQPTFPGVQAVPVSDTHHAVDFILAPGEKTIVGNGSLSSSFVRCGDARLSLLHDGGSGFQLVSAEIGRAIQYRTASFTVDGGFFAFIQDQGFNCNDSNYFVSLKADGTGKTSRSPLTYGSSWQGMSAVFGSTFLTYEWRSATSETAPDAWVLRDVARVGGPVPRGFGRSMPAVDAAGKVAVWYDPANVFTISGTDMTIPVPITFPAGAWACQVAWSPDGARLAYRWGVGGCNSDPGVTVTIVDRAGTNARDLGTTTINYPAPVFSPDGQSVAFAELLAGGQRQVVVRATAGAASVAIAAPPSIPIDAWSAAVLRFSPSSKGLLLEINGVAFFAPVAGGTFINVGGPGGVFSTDETRYASRVGLETMVASTSDPGGPSVLSAESDFAPSFSRAAGVSRLVMSDRRAGGQSDLVLADAGGANRIVVASVNTFSAYAIGGTNRARRWMYPTWIGDVVVWLGPPRTTNIGKAFDLMAVTADGKTTGVLAPDVLGFDFTANGATSIFFVRVLPGDQPRLWRVNLPGR